jgi:hypothetical protein
MMHAVVVVVVVLHAAAAAAQGLFPGCQHPKVSVKSKKGRCHAKMKSLWV